ncbi:MAG: hypothetical protein DI622_19320 [Chryseobacterium sp.]|nr:MAG: hypothetical protein DI622_19320 [Chryseobacterium sp.]
MMALIYSCRNNELLTEHDNEVYNNSSQFKLTSKVISLDESKHKEKLASVISDVQNKVSKIQNKAFGKNINYDNIIIDTKNVTYIENGPNYHTYTFRIFRENAPNDGLVENLLLTPLPDGSYKEFLITYNFTEQEKKTILAGGDVSRKGKMNIVELDQGTFGNPLAKSSSCSYQDVDVYISCADGVHNSSNVGSWGSCIHKGKPGAPVYYSFVALVCVDDPDSPGGISNPPSGGGGGGGGGGTTNPNPNPPCVIAPTDPTGVGLVDNDGNPCTVGVPTVPVLSSFPIYVRNLPADLKALINDSANSDFYIGLKNYYDINLGDYESTEYVNWALQFKKNNQNMSWEVFWNNKFSVAPNSSIDVEDNEAGNYDETIFENFDFENQQAQWPTINPVIAASDFVGWGANGIRRNCMDYAKAQIAKSGFKVSNYYDVDSQGNKQTFQIYTEQGGVNLNDLYKGVSYLKYALSNGIPVIVGIDDKTGHPGNLDNSTDHFVVIVGMGTDSKGRYFRFYDNAAGDVNQGTHPENKLYIKYPDRIFTGQTQCIAYRAGTEYDYIMTMIRKSK